MDILMDVQDAVQFGKTSELQHTTMLAESALQRSFPRPLQESAKCLRPRTDMISILQIRWRNVSSHPRRRRSAAHPRKWQLPAVFLLLYQCLWRLHPLTRLQLLLGVLQVLLLRLLCRNLAVLHLHNTYISCK